jgi:hypothetical protein
MVDGSAESGATVEATGVRAGRKTINHQPVVRGYYGSMMIRAATGVDASAPEYQTCTR